MNYNDFFENKEIPVISNLEGFENIMKQLDSYKLIHINRNHNKNEYYGYEPFLSSIYLIKNCKQVGEYKQLSPKELKNFYQNIISNKDEQVFEGLPVNREEIQQSIIMSNIYQKKLLEIYWLTL